MIRLIQTSPSSVALLLVLSLTASIGCKSGPRATEDADPTSSGESAEGRASVVLYEYQFNPDNITIQSGKTIVFKNKDIETHAVAVEALNIEQTISPGQNWSHAFETTGTFEITNPRLDRSMTMTLVVE